MQTTTKTTLSALVVAALALAVLPTAEAAPADYGTFVEAFDVDTIHPLGGAFGVTPGDTGGTVNTAFGFVDANGNTAFDAGETMYLDIGGTGAVAAFDVRLTPFGTNPAFSQVLVTDNDAGNGLTLVGGAGGSALAFYDFDGNSAWSIDDWFYVDSDLSGAVSPGDVRLALPPGASESPGTRVGTGAADENRGLTGIAAPAPTFDFFDADRSGGYNLGDGVYVDQDGGTVGPGPNFITEDLRLVDLGGGLDPGRVLQPDSIDVTHVLSAAGIAPVFLFIDDNGNGAFDSGEIMYFDTDGDGVVDAFEFRMSPAAEAGKVVGPSHSDVGVGTALGAAAFAFYDNDGNGAWSIDDWLYVDTDGSGSVTPGDVRYSDNNPNGAVGTRVGSLDGDETRPLTAMGGFTVEFFDADNSGGFNTGDTYYLQQTGAAVNPQQEDIRLLALGDLGPGTYVRFDSPDIVYSTALIGGGPSFPVGPPAISFGFLDDNGNGAYDQGERMFFDLDASATVSGGDVLLSEGTSTACCGTQIRGSDPLVGSGLTAVALGAFSFYDNDGNSAWSVDDHVYLDVANVGVVSAGDVRLSATASGGIGTRVNSGDSDEGRGIAAAPGGTAVANFEFFDTDKNGAYNIGDLVYYLQAAGRANQLVEDFRLSGTGSVSDPIFTGTTTTTTTTQPGQTTTTTTDSGQTTTTTTDSGQTTTTTQAGGGGTTTTTDGPDTPGFELVALVAALGAALVLVRRRL